MLQGRRTATVLAGAVLMVGVVFGSAVGARATSATHKTLVGHAQSARTVAKGKRVTFAVTLRDAKTRQPLRSSTAKLQYKHGSAWVTRNTVRTGSKGTASTAFRPATTHLWRWVGAAFVRSGVKHAQGVSTPFTVAVKAPPAMNFAQISHGNYRALLGKWVEVAFAGSGLGGPGFQWHPHGTDTLAVTTSKIVNGSIVVRGATLSDGQGLTNAKLVFKRTGKYLAAGLADQSVARNYEIDFYPRGVPTNEQFNNGVKVSSATNRIVVWTSNNSYTEVFSEK